LKGPGKSSQCHCGDRNERYYWFETSRLVWLPEGRVSSLYHVSSGAPLPMCFHLPLLLFLLVSEEIWNRQVCDWARASLRIGQPLVCMR
jgi:hypothetical protein